MNRFQECADAFDHTVSRSRDMIQLYSGLSLIRDHSTNDDALRAAYFQAISSFDFFVHEIVAVEASHRFRTSVATRNIVLPMEITMIADQADRFTAVDLTIRERNSYKSFVDPSKLAEILSCFCDKPWHLIEEQHNILHSLGVNQSALKAQLKSIWQRRNKIAHEADIDPTLSGVSLWPIDQTDTEITVTFIENLGKCLPNVISQPL